jgi:bifunctional DNA-binding transcriptional regulator/antitoxin component of YhaV-PrlF toxin-antitoxin module
MLPANWRRKYGIEPSSELVVREEKDGAFRVETREQGIRRAQALVRRYILAKVSLVD